MNPLKPKQKRSAERYDRLLDAAAALISENGVGGFALSTVGKRIGISQGSLYQYFPSKTAILLALHQRYADHVHATLLDMEKALDLEKSPAPVEAFVDQIMNRFAPFYTNNPAYRELRKHASLLTADAEDSLDRKIIEIVSRILLRINPDRGADHARLTAAVLLEIADALLIGSEESQDWRHETRLALCSYLSASLVHNTPPKS